MIIMMIITIMINTGYSTWPSSSFILFNADGLGMSALQLIEQLVLQLPH
jgi:hypothetical protein